MKNLTKDIKKYFEEIGYEITREENGKSSYKFGSVYKTDDIITTTDIVCPHKASFILIRFCCKYEFKNNDHNKIYELVNIINANLMNIGTMTIDALDENEICFITSLYLPTGQLDKFQFEQTLKLLTSQALPIYDLIKQVDIYRVEPKQAIKDIMKQNNAGIHCEQYEIVPQQKNNHKTKTQVSSFNFSKSFNNENEIILTDMQVCFQNENLPILGEMERQAVGKRPYDLSFKSWCMVSSNALSIICFYIPEYKIAVIELGGFQNMKQTADIDFFFHTTNKMQFKNRWVYYPETNKVFLRGVHILPSYGVDKKQFQMLIKNTIKASEIFYPFIQELTQTDKEPYEVLEEFGTQNKKVIDNFNYK